MDQVLNLADQVISASPQLNILINNAGVYLKDREITSDGFEKTMAINHFATHLLTKKLLDKIEISKNSRIINVSSIAHEGTGLDLENMEFEDNFSGYKAYATSKLANILFTKSLSSRLRGNTTANCLHPGVISTKLLHAGFNIKGAPTSKGSVTSVYLSESEHLNGIQGRYFINCKETNPSKIARNKTLAEELWHITEERLGKFL